MKLTENHFRYMILGIAIFLLLFDTIKRNLNIIIPQALETVIVITLFIIAIVLFIYGRSLRNRKKENQ